MVVHRHVAAATVIVLGLAGCDGAQVAAPAQVENKAKPSNSVVIDTPAGPVLAVVSAGRFSRAQAVKQPHQAPEGYEYPVGFLAININQIAAGEGVTLTLTLPEGIATDAYVKCASTGGACARFAGVAIAGNVVTLSLTDGGAGDADGLADGVIHDPGAPARALTTAARPIIRVLSSVAREPILTGDGLVSGDDALVEIVLPEGAGDARVSLNGADVTAQFARRVNGRYMGLLSGLAIGDNTLSAQVAGGTPATATIRNFPNGGPIFSGPQVQPWRCQAGAVDAQCNQPAEYRLLYKSTDPNRPGLQPYDPESPPDDVATTTTQNGRTLPFIVRQERGYQARDEYKILTLFQPGQAWAPWAPQPQWIRKVLVTHGGSCGTDHGTGGAPLDDYAGTIPPSPAFEHSYVVALGQGFAVMSTALDNLGHNCNLVTAAESLMMAKERLVEQYGELRYTIGTGCSGGSITQQHVANAYPGIYDGLITTCAYPDALSTGAQFADLHLLRLYFEDPSKWGEGIAWTPQQFADVEGHATHLNAITTDELFFKGVTDPTSCDGGVPADQRYHPELNPTGVRCGLMDYMINVLGARPPEVWSPMEVAAGRGFGGFFAANDGIQYGLNALRAGRITPAQFVDLNRKIGGLDIDFKPAAQRLQGDVASIEAAYLSGAVNSTNHMDQVAIINSTGPDPGAAHDTVHAWWTRWRLDREQGHHDNHVMWGGPAPLIGDPNYLRQSLFAMDRWLAAVEADAGDSPRARKIVANKPADVHDQCSDGAGHKVLDEICPELIQGRFTTPRQVAGGPITDDVMKCRLKPLNRADDYGPLGLLTFTDAQWAQLQALFAEGVCDYRHPGVRQQGTVAWRDYSDAPGVQYSGTYTPPPDSEGGFPLCEPFMGNCMDDLPVAGPVIQDLVDEVYDTVTGAEPPAGPPGGGLPDQCDPFFGSGYCLSDIPVVGDLFEG